MKKFTLHSLLILGLLIIPMTVNAGNTQTALQKASQYSRIYKKWAVPLEHLKHNSSVWDGKVDCTGLENGETKGGDLLSSMIGDPEGRKLIKLKVYTPDYVKNLENKIVQHTKAKFKADFFAFKVCHLGKDLDVAAGYLWPTGKKVPLYEQHDYSGLFPELQKKSVLRKFGDQAALIIVNKGKVYSYKVTKSQPIQLVNVTATGAEVEPCDVALQNGKILWSCFSGLNRVGNRIEGSRMKYWLFPLNGKQPEKTWEAIVR